MCHDPTTLSVALGLDMVPMRTGRITLDHIGRTLPDPDGIPVMHSTPTADHEQIMAWITRTITTAATGRDVIARA